jgi:hypothetical protein
MEFFSRTGPTAADMGDARGSWAESMRALPFRAWVRLLLSIFEACLAQVRAVSRVQRMLRDVIGESYPHALALNSAEAQQATYLLSALDSASADQTGLASEPNASTTDVQGHGSLGGQTTAAEAPTISGEHAQSRDGLEESQALFDDGLDELEQTLGGDMAAAAEVDLSQLDRKDSAAAAGRTASEAAGSASASSGQAQLLGEPSTLRVAAAEGHGNSVTDPAADASTFAPEGSTAIIPFEEQLRSLIAGGARGMVEFAHQTHVRCAKLLSARVKDGADAALTASQCVHAGLALWT